MSRLLKGRELQTVAAGILAERIAVCQARISSEKTGETVPIRSQSHSKTRENPTAEEKETRKGELTIGTKRGMASPGATTTVTTETGTSATGTVLRR